jgi:long-chain acyl-CoA synthetase
LPLPGRECRIVDEDDHELPAGEAGEIVVRGPGVMKGYDGDAKGTVRAVRNGWLHTGDRGYVDPDGYYFLKDSGTA